MTMMDVQILLINAAIARANIRAMGMVSENIFRTHRGETIAYGEHAFASLIEEEQIGREEVEKLLAGVTP